MIDVLFAAGNPGDWSAFPFGPGFTGSWLLAVCKFVFIGLVLTLIIWLLRKVFGPGGPLRDEGLDREAEAARAGRLEALRILDRRLASGEITDEDYVQKKKLLEE